MNLLSKETSPYLLQHKNNPVEWFAWNDEAWSKARNENKLVLVSIGYSACHWCHVMEHEVFEDFESAEIMNRHFVCIKVDREERPDIDQVYMDAVHLMGSQGGWPLNVFTLPDGRPVFGGTYFPQKNWINILENLVDLYKTESGKVIDYATQLQEGLDKLNGVSVDISQNKADENFIRQKVEHWSKYWDQLHGGARKAPKFPMPNNWEFLLDYAVLNNDQSILDFVHLTLEKMALGGIYDQIGGGFSRYSVDDIWKVPHFEKMLYDNAQLISLYSKAYRQFNAALYKDIIEQTINWLLREMRSDSGLFYAALDADSEGVEGKFYVWKEEEVEEILGEEFALASMYYNLGGAAHWEHGNNILLRSETDEEFAVRHTLELDDLRVRIDAIQKKLLSKRSERVRPGLDFKCIASWNGLAVTALCEAHKALPQNGYREIALQTIAGIQKGYVREDLSLYHIHTSGKSTIEGFLDDYVFIADGFFAVFEITGDESFAQTALQLAEKALELFGDETEGLCFYTSSIGEKLITRKKEFQDNVIPAANSALARLLKKLATVFDQPHLRVRASKMESQLGPMIDFASGYSNWLNSMMQEAYNHFEVVISGTDVAQTLQDWHSNYHPNCMALPLTNESSLPVFKGRFSQQTVFYVCTQSHCLPPVKTKEEAMKLIQSN
ncbi:MAG: thioredoxin domain-containing protein [Flavobacteriales bacterium]